MTNYEYELINFKPTVYQLATMLSTGLKCNDCNILNFCTIGTENFKSCRTVFVNWLQQEVEGNI